MAGSELQSFVYQRQFRSTFGDAFQSWISSVLTALYPPGEFQCIRKTQGDGGFDGFVINEQHVYQIYAPARIDEMRDGDTARKIQEDFEKAVTSLNGRIRKWTFIHNHPEGSLGKRSIQVLSELEYLYSSVEFRALGIHSLWDLLQEVPESNLAILFGSSSTRESKAERDQGRPDISTLSSVVLIGASPHPIDPNSALSVIQPDIVAVVRAAMADGFPGAEQLANINKARFERARNELLNGFAAKAESDYRTLISDLETQEYPSPILMDT
jgi:hypothetical protein